MHPVPTLLTRVLPTTALARALSAQSILYAVGEGAFLTGSAVFFTRVVGLSAAQVGLGLTIAGVDNLQVKADTKRFKEFIEEHGGESGQWRGDVHRPGL